MPPSLSTYQAAAQSIYEPAKAADITTAQNTTATQIANEEALKPQIQTDYQTAIDNLTSATNSNVAKINQLYTERLGGNFSGLQGNDLGGMFSKAGAQRATIESTRANKLAAIATTETNDQNSLAATISSLKSKYQGEEANYANTAYSSAVKEYNTEQYQQQQLALREQSLQISAERAAASASNAASSAASKTAAMFGLKQGSQGQYMFTGPNGQPVNMGQYLFGGSGGDIGTMAQTARNLLSNGTGYDKSIYAKVKGIQDPTAFLQAVSNYDKANYYGLRQG